MNNIKNRDLIMGKKCENMFLKKFTKFKKLDKFNKFDFINKKIGKSEKIKLKKLED